MTQPDGAERFRRLHTAARDLLDDLESRYSVRREEFVDEGRNGLDGPGVLLRPDDGAAASLGVTFTEAPGLWTWVAGRRGSHLPADARGAVTPRDCELHLEGFAEAVVISDPPWTRRPEGTVNVHTADEFLGLTEIEAHAWAGALGWTVRDRSRPGFYTDDLRYDRVNLSFDDRGVVVWAKIS